ncbi:MAG: hypothetical protein WCK74_03030 [Gemmatimonadaceae bacterium]|jgi:hypothetical protein
MMTTTASSTSAITALQDSGAAYVTRPGGPPDNGAYRTAAYAIAIGIYAVYLVILLRRMARERARAAAR